MHKVKTIVDKFKKDNNKINQLNRKKTYDPKNIINLDTDISEMDTHIKNYPTIKKKNSFIERPIKTIPFSNINLNNKKFIKKKSYNDANSITTTTSYGGEKAMKKVTFSTVEIIRIEKYKKYNAMNNFSKRLIDKNMEEFKQNDSKISCSIF